MIYKLDMPVRKLLWALLLVCVPLGAQTSSGEIDITVQDSSGAAIPKASITITGSTTGNLVRTLTIYLYPASSRKADS